jgi:ankyrin repeat protein
MKHGASEAEIERCKEAEKFRKIDAAFRNGDLEALRASVDGPDYVPNGPMPPAVGTCLEYAIYHSPLPFIHTLLDIGADPNPTDHAGFPPLIAALSCSRSQPGSPGRNDTLDIIRLLLMYGANPNQRGINDYTPLHMAVGERHMPAIEALLEAGADPRGCSFGGSCSPDRTSRQTIGVQPCVLVWLPRADVDVNSPGDCYHNHAHAQEQGSSD